MLSASARISIRSAPVAKNSNPAVICASVSSTVESAPLVGSIVDAKPKPACRLTDLRRQLKHFQHNRQGQPDRQAQRGLARHPRHDSRHTLASADTGAFHSGQRINVNASDSTIFAASGAP